MQGASSTCADIVVSLARLERRASERRDPWGRLPGRTRPVTSLHGYSSQPMESTWTGMEMLTYVGRLTHQCSAPTTSPGFIRRRTVTRLLLLLERLLNASVIPEERELIKAKGL